MKHRKLRIAWSVAWGIMAVLLIGLWVRSHYSCDTVVRTSQSLAVTFCSNIGVIYVTGSDPSDGYSSPPPKGKVTWDRYSLTPGDLLTGFHWTWSPTLKSFQLPHWFAIIVATMVAALSWLRWSNRFSLRTLLIATTLVAVGLGLIVWAARLP